jgi:hypothetical protein
MTKPITLWTASRHHAAFRCGGWASVRVVDGVPSGSAGGERATTAARMALAGLAAGLRDLPATMEVAIHASGGELADLNEILAGRLQPEDHLDLWARILVATKGRRTILVRAGATPDGPMSFAKAWADLAMDKAKMGGAFSASIPRGNLAKVEGL